MFLTIGLAVAAVLVFLGRHIIGGLFGLYRIVPVNEAHIRIMNNKKEIFSSRTGKSSYWIIPFVTKLQKLPLTNIAIPTDNIKLNDINMAKFMCDVMCFINIDNIDLAVERLVLTPVSHAIGFDVQALSSDMRAMMESICRTVATKQDILTIYMNRQALVQAITAEVQTVFPNWGIKLVNLELKHIKDAEGSTIIADIERKVAADIRRDADIRVATTEREAKVAQAEAMETYKRREIQRDQAVEIAKQDAAIAIQQRAAEANIQAIEADRKLHVGKAEISKQIVEQEAMAEKIKFSVEAEGKSKQIITVGEAEADIIRIKKEAEAAGTLKLAEAMKAFNDVALNVKILDIQRDVTIEKYKALAMIGEHADIKWIMSGANAQSFFGLDLTAQGGANLEQFLSTLNIGAGKVQEILNLIKKA